MPGPNNPSEVFSSFIEGLKEDSDQRKAARQEARDALAEQYKRDQDALLNKKFAEDTTARNFGIFQASGGTIFDSAGQQAAMDAAQKAQQTPAPAGGADVTAHFAADLTKAQPAAAVAPVVAPLVQGMNQAQAAPAPAPAPVPATAAHAPAPAPAPAAVPPTQQGLANMGKVPEGYTMAFENGKQKLVKNPTQAKGVAGAPGSGVLSPKGLALAAGLFAQTGQMPPMGLAAGARVQIMNAAGENVGAGQVVEAMKKFAADKATQIKLTAQAGVIGAFEKTAKANLDLALGMSDKVDRTGIPVINRLYLNYKGNYKGDPDTAKFKAYVQTAINEYAKVTSSITGGGVTSDSARKEIEDLLASSQTQEQFRAVVDGLYRDMDNRVAGYASQLTGKPMPGEKAGTPAAAGGDNWNAFDPNVDYTK